MTRLLFALSFVVMAGAIFYIYQNNILTELMRPAVQVLETNRPILAGQKYRESSIVIRQIPGREAGIDTLTFPIEATREQILGLLEQSETSRRLDKGDILKVTDVGTVQPVFVLHTRTPIRAGDPLNSENIEIVRSTGRILEGAIVFQSQQRGLEFFASMNDPKSGSNLGEGQVLVANDLVGGGAAIFALRTIRDVERFSLLSVADIEVIRVSGDGVERGMIAFSSEGSAEAYVVSQGNLRVSYDLPRDTVLTLDAVTAPVTEPDPGAARPTPRTLDELLEYQALYPDETIFIDDSILVGSPPMPGMVADLWMETGRTEGLLGTIRIERIAEGIKVLQVSAPIIQPQAVLVGQQAGPADGTAGDGDAAVPEPVKLSTADLSGVYHWAEIGKEMTRTIREARAELRVAFLLPREIAIGDFVGNGSVCKEDYCTVNRQASNDLSTVRNALYSIEAMAPDADETVADPFTVLDGVDDLLEERMVASGITTFQQIADWKDGDIKTLVIQLEIPSRNLAIYIRQQARNIVGNPERSRRELGLAESPAVGAEEDGRTSSEAVEGFATPIR